MTRVKIGLPHTFEAKFMPIYDIIPPADCAKVIMFIIKMIYKKVCVVVLQIMFNLTHYLFVFNIVFILIMNTKCPVHNEEKLVRSA